MDKSKLLGRTLQSREVEIEGVGTVVVRALSRAEVLAIQKEMKGNGPNWLERKMLLVALVDPVLTEEEIETWYRVSPAGELDVVVAAISDISGMNKEADKEAMRNFRGRFEHGDGLHAGGETSDDRASVENRDAQ